MIGQPIKRAVYGGESARHREAVALHGIDIARGAFDPVSQFLHAQQFIVPGRRRDYFLRFVLRHSNPRSFARPGYLLTILSLDAARMASDKP